jgi:hypothetical protein
VAGRTAPGGGALWLQRWRLEVSAAGILALPGATLMRQGARTAVPPCLSAALSESVVILPGGEMLSNNSLRDRQEVAVVALSSSCLV